MRAITYYTHYLILNTTALGLTVDNIYNVTLLVKDSFGNNATDTVFVTVVPQGSINATNPLLDILELVFETPLGMILGLGAGFIVGIAVMVILSKVRGGSLRKTRV